jgi:gluconolactonase
VAFETITDKLRFPEGPIVLADGSVIVVEIDGGALTRVTPDCDLQVISKLDGGPNGAALGPDGWVVVANSGGWHYTSEANGWRRPTGQSETSGWIERVSLATGRSERIYEASGGVRLQSPNDLVFDALGNFYVTDHGKRDGRTLGLGAVHYGAADGSFLRPVITGLITPNGIGLSVDGKTLFLAETITRRVLSYAVTAPGEVSLLPWPAPAGGHLVAGLPDRNFLDSMAIDAEGHICVASFNACGIWRIAPDGSARHFIPIDDYYATNIAFGGPDRRTAFVTLSSTGRLVAFPWVCPGQPLAFEG